MANLKPGEDDFSFKKSEKEKQASHMAIANSEVIFHNNELEKRAAELVIANKELAFQIGEIEKRAAELVMANNELAFQIGENEKRAAELTAAIQKAYEEKNLILESIDDGFFATDKNLLINYWNKEAEFLLGVQKADIVGKTLHEMFSDSKSPIFYDNFQKALRENTTIRFEGYSNRTKKWFSVRAFASDNVLSVYLKDITDQKNDEEGLIQIELRYRSLIEHASDAICIVDTNMKFIEINDMGCQISGYSREEVLQLSVVDMLFEEELKTNPLRILSLSPGNTFLYERKLKKKDGTALEMELSGKMMEDGRVLIFIRDISERKKAALLIAESEAKYSSFFESSMDGFLFTTPNGEILSANPAACETFKMTEAEICAAGRHGLVDLTDTRYYSLLEKRQTTGRAKGELTLLRKDGSKFEAELSSAVFTDSYGRARTSMIFRDISGRKLQEEKLATTLHNLQQTHNDLTKVMDSSKDVICAVNAKGYFVKVSAAAESVWGYKPCELIGKLIFDFVYPEDREKTQNQAVDVMSGNSSTYLENRYVRKDGTVVPIEWSVRWDETDQLRYGVARDVTDKKRLEKANEIERQRFLGLYLQAPSCMGILKGPNHEFEMANPLYLQLINKSDIIGKTVKEVLPELESQGIFDFLDTVYTTGNTFSANEMLVKFDFKGTGELVDTYLNFIYQAHRNQDGQIDGIVFFAIDVTEQVLSRKKIEEREREIRSLAESMPQIVWVTNAQGENTYFNQQWVDYTGLTLEESNGFGWTKPFHREDKTRAWEAWKIALETLTEYVIECRLQCYDGSYRWWLIRGVPKINDNGEILKWYGTCTDIENIKQTEEKLKKQAKELALSNTELEQFAYVASHDLQEPLRMVTSFLKLLEKKYRTVIDDKGREYIDFAVDGANRMRQIILDLLELSRVGSSEENQEDIDLNELVEEVQILNRKTIREKNALIISEPLPHVTSYRSTLLQVFQNLIGNALKYTDKDRAVRINITSAEFDDHWQLAVHDNGIGIDQEYFDKIFIIFQRLHTKDEYSGTGIGLAITKKIIENQGGKIWVESEEGTGSTFYFTIIK